MRLDTAGLELSLVTSTNLKDRDIAVGLSKVAVSCCVCNEAKSSVIAEGEDFEYRTSDDTFKVHCCDGCSLVFLNPRPAVSEFTTIYPDRYHAFEFSEEEFGLVYKIRRRLEARRLLSWCEGLDKNARILDVGCGDGFHLELLADFGDKTWDLEGIDMDERAVSIGRKRESRSITEHLNLQNFPNQHLI